MIETKTEVATISPRATMLEAIREQREEIASYLPPHVHIDRFLSLACRAVINNREIWECSSSSVLRALGAAAASGLPVDGNMSSLVVRRPKEGKPIAIWDPTYRGMCHLALESGHVLSIAGHAVHEHDVFSVALGSNPKITHEPYLGPDRGRVVAAYAIAVLRGRGTMREVLGMADLEKIRASSPAGERGPWGTWPDRMAMKSAVRRLLKRLPAADIGTLGRAQQYVLQIDGEPAEVTDA